MDALLLLVDGIGHGQALAALGATTVQDSLAPTVFHTGTEALLVGALAIVRLESSFHGITFKTCVYELANVDKNAFLARETRTYLI